MKDGSLKQIQVIRSGAKRNPSPEDEAEAKELVDEVESHKPSHFNCAVNMNLNEVPMSYVRQPYVTSEEFTYLPDSILIPSQLRPAASTQRRAISRHWIVNRRRRPGGATRSTSGTSTSGSWPAGTAGPQASAPSSRFRRRAAGRSRRAGTAGPTRLHLGANPLDDEVDAKRSVDDQVGVGSHPLLKVLVNRPGPGFIAGQLSYHML